MQLFTHPRVPCPFNLTEERWAILRPVNAGIRILCAGRLFKVITENEVATSPTQPDDLLPRAMHVGEAKWAGGQR